MNKPAMKALLLCAISTFSIFAEADYEEVGGIPAPQPLQIAPSQPSLKQANPMILAESTGGLNNAGRRPVIIPPIKGFGRQVYLQDALAMIIPANVRVFNDVQADLSKKVDWDGRANASWTTTLDNLLKATGLSATMNWDQNTLSFEKSPQVAKLLAVQSQARVWTLTEGRNVGKELKGWALEAGWKVVWNLNKDWAVPANTSFSGDFKSSAGEVIKTLAANGILIKAEFYDGNKTMLVSGPGVTEQ